jgi:hypothetical protein
LSCLFLVTASRMRACARDTASQLCVRTVLCSSAFSWPGPFAPRAPQRPRPLCSLASSLLRAGPTSPSRSSSATASGLPDNVPATTGGDGDGDLPVPVQKASAHARVYDEAGSACVSRCRHRPCCLLWDGNISTPNLSYAAQYLACALPCERFTSALAGTRASLGAGAVRYSFTVTDFHRLPFAGLPAHPSTASNSDGPPKEKPRTLTSPRQDEVNLQ